MMFSLKRYPAVICVFLLSTSTWGADRFVSPIGDDDNPGTQVLPWKTIQRAADLLAAGDTAHIAEGVYNEKIEINVSGNEKDGFVTFKAEGKSVVSGRGIVGANIIVMENKSYVKIIGLELEDMQKARDGSGIRVEGYGEHIEIRDNKIHNIKGKDAMGITIYGTSPVRSISNLIIDGNEIYDCEPAQSEALVLNGNVEKFEVTNNYVHDVNNIGIDFIGGENWNQASVEKVARDGICKNNRVEGAKANYGDGYAAGIYVDGGRNIVIEENIVTGCNLGIEVGAENSEAVATGIIVRNNVIYKNEKAGIVVGGFSKKSGRVRDCKFIGNVCYHNATDEEDAQAEIWLQFARDCEFTGNTLATREGAFLVQSGKFAEGITLDNNTWHSGDGTESAMFIWMGKEVEGWAAYRKLSGQDAGSTFTMPKFEDPEKGKFKLLGQSTPAEP
jgi:hypothetical protein